MRIIQNHVIIFLGTNHKSKKGSVSYGRGSKGNDEYIMLLVENTLLKQILEIYEDISTTSKIKREKRAKITEEFVEMLEKELNRPKGEIRQIVDNKIAKARWIEEIEELDEEELDEEELDQER